MDDEKTQLSVVVIGRNEGIHLKECLNSVLKNATHGNDNVEVIYIDSASTDNSRDIASSLGIKVIRVESAKQTAARARNNGWQAAQGEFILFLDGDCVLEPGFLSASLLSFEDPSVAVVSGNIREGKPSNSIYNRILELDWKNEPGETFSCGGNALIRRKNLEIANGYDSDLDAGEEADMCRRLRSLGYKIIHIDTPMVVHNLDMMSFGQYWKRAYRTGYAYAEVSDRYRDTDDPLWATEYMDNWLKGGFLLILSLWAFATAILMKSFYPLLVWFVILAFLSIRTAQKVSKRSDSVLTIILYGIHSHLVKIPIFFGQLGYLWSRSRKK
jgi:glycosyltransferase involved in cell wall biosynthesis